VLEGETKKGKIIKNKNKFQYKLLILMAPLDFYERKGELMNSILRPPMGFKMECGEEQKSSAHEQYSYRNDSRTFFFLMWLSFLVN
jgi:hypothetical protein